MKNAKGKMQKGMSDRRGMKERRQTRVGLPFCVFTFAFGIA
jgi:hypothetical protein